MNDRRRLYIASAVRVSAFLGLSLAMTQLGAFFSWNFEILPEVGRQVALESPLPAPFYSADLVAFGLLSTLAGYALLVCCLRFMESMKSARQRRELAAMGQGGQAMTEFAVIFPIVLVTTLGLMQAALIYNARNLVAYAAFNTARSASVYIPAEYDGEAAMVLGDNKRSVLRNAAALSLVPAAPRISQVLSNLGGIGSFAGNLIGSLSGVLGSIPGAGFLVDGGERYLYNLAVISMQHNLIDIAGFFAGNSMQPRAVQVYQTRGGNSIVDRNSGNATFSGGDSGEPDVTVVIDYKFYLMIPLANGVFGTSFLNTTHSMNSVRGFFASFYLNNPFSASSFFTYSAWLGIEELNQSIRAMEEDLVGAFEEADFLFNSMGRFAQVTGTCTLPLEVKFGEPNPRPHWPTIGSAPSGFSF